MEKVIKRHLSITSTNRGVENLDHEIYSQDKGTAVFKFTTDELTASKVLCLFYFKETKRYRTVEAAIEGNTITIPFDSTSIITDEPVIGYIYFEKVEQSTDVYAFTFNVWLSAIDKARKAPLVERATGRIVDVENIVTKQELDVLFEKIKEQGGTYDDSGLRTEISQITGKIEALERKTDNDTIYDDEPLKRRLTALESKPEIDTSQYATKEELASKANQSEIAHILDDIETLKTKPDNNTIYDDKPLRDRVEALENKPSVDTSNLVTRSDLDSRGYLTQHQSLDSYAKRSEIPEPYNDTELKERVGRLENKPSIDTSKFVKEETLASKGYLTQHQSLEGYAKKSEIPQPYSDTEVKQRLSVIEQKEPQKLSLDGNTVSLSGGGGSIVLPSAPATNTGGQVNQYEIHGTGMPNGKVTAPVGTTYVDTDVTNGALKWIKRRGNDNQGWEVLTGDTGWCTLNIQSKLGNSFLKVRRKNDTVTYQFGGLQWGWFGIIRRGGPGYSAQASDRERNCFILMAQKIPMGFRSESSLIGTVYNDKGKRYGTWYLAGPADGNHLRFQFDDPIPTDNDIGDIRVSSISYLTSEAWPTTLP